METPCRRSCIDTTGLCWREPATFFPESTVDFCQETSLHGVKYVCQPKRHLTERLFWLVTLVIGGITAGLLIRNLWQEYLHKPIITLSPFETTIGEIPFPAITICNSNRLRRSGLEKLVNTTEWYLNLDDQEELKNAKYVDVITDIFLALHVCNKQTTFGQSVNFTHARNKRNVQDVLDQLAVLAQKINEINPNITNKIWSYFMDTIPHRCKNMIKECRLNNKIVKCSDHFQHEGINRQGCCSFNQVPQVVYNTMTGWSLEKLKLLTQASLENKSHYEKDKIYWYNDLVTKDGLLFPPSSMDGIDAVVPGNISNKDKWYRPKRQQNSGKSEGLSILLNPELEEYTCGFTDGDGFLLQVHSLTDSSNVEEVSMLIKPNSEVFVEVTPIVTIANENLKNIPIINRRCYFQNEKQLATSWFYTLDICIDECIHNLTKKHCDCYLARVSQAKLYCELEDFDCAQDYKRNTTRNEYARSCNCLPLCTTVEYSTHVTSTEIDNGRQVKGWNYMSTDDNSTAVSTNQLSIVHIYFAKEYVYALERKKLYGWVDLIANAGGVLGLCLGFSALSFLECVYFLTFRLWCQVRRRKSVLEILATNMTRLLERKQDDENVPENRRVMFAIKQIHDQVFPEQPPSNEYQPNELSEV